MNVLAPSHGSQPPASAVGDGVLTAADDRTARLSLLLVAVGLMLLHSLFTDLSRPINWDEAVHLTQVIPQRPSVFLEPHRTRGLTVLVAPIAIFDPSMVAFRLYLLVGAAAGVFAAFATWIRVIGLAAPLAAAVFVTYWVTVFYTVELLPNLPAALFTVAVLGLAAQAVLGHTSRRLPLQLGLLFLLFTLVRPPDAVLAGIALTVGVLLFRREVWRKTILPGALGGLTGLAVWFVEGWVRFGFGPAQLAASGAERSIEGQHGAWFFKLPLYLSSLENRLRCPGACQQQYLDAGGGWSLPPGRTTAFLAMAALLALVAFVLAPRAWRRAATFAVLALVAVLSFYGVTGGGMNLRYIMPAFAVGLLPPSMGTVLLARRVGGPGGHVLRASLLVLIVATMVWQAGQGLHRLSGEGTRFRAAVLGTALAAHTDDRDCVVGADSNYPQIQYWTRCEATALRVTDDRLQAPLGETGSYVDLAAAAERGDRVFAIVRRRRIEGSPLAAWRELPFDGHHSDNFALLEWPGDVEVPAPPCPDDVPGEPRRLTEAFDSDC